MYAKKIIEYLGNKKGVDVRINGSRPHDIQVHNSSLYRRLLFNYSLGLGEGYMRGDWSCEDLEGMLRQCLQILVRSEHVSLLSRIQHTALNMQSALRSRQVAERHYDIGNDLYEAMLDPYMQYSCAYWNNRHYLGRRPARENGSHLPKAALRIGIENTGYRVRIWRIDEAHAGQICG